MRILFVIGFVCLLMSCSRNKHFYGENADAFNKIRSLYNELNSTSAHSVFFINNGFTDVQIYWKESRTHEAFKDFANNTALRAKVSERGMEPEMYIELLRQMKKIRCKFVQNDFFDVNKKTATRLGFNAPLRMKYKTYWMLNGYQQGDSFFDPGMKHTKINDSVYFSYFKAPGD